MSVDLKIHSSHNSCRVIIDWRHCLKANKPSHIKAIFSVLGIECAFSVCAVFAIAISKFENGIMMRTSLLSAVLLLTILTHQVRCDGYYTIVGSQYIRPNSNYHVAVTVHDSTTPSTLKIGIKTSSSDDADNNKDDGVYVAQKELTIDPQSTQLIELQTGDLQSTDGYKLVADGLSGLKFHNETSLTLHAKSFSVFIQMDKAIYKPGDTVQFRVLILDPNMKPFGIKGPIKIFINDGSGNRIKQWNNVDTKMGVFGDELPLSEFPVLGDWQMFVEVMGETKSKTFEVAEYVLPKFEVTIDTPKHQVFKAGKILATIRAKYTYGKPVKGEATVSIQPSFRGSFQPLIDEVLIRKTIKVDGKGYVEFDLKDDLKITEEYQRDYAIEAIVEEELTGRKQSGRFTVTLHKYPYNIERIGQTYKYKPGLPFDLMLKVANHDGSPVQDNVNKVKISYGDDYRQENRTKIEQNLDSNGMVHVVLQLPENITSFLVNAEYLGLEESLGYFRKEESETGTYLQATIRTQTPTINKEVVIEVESTETMTTLTYQILGRGDIIVSKTETVPDARIHRFKFLATFAMAPKARLIVYYLRDGEMVSDNLQIEFGDDLQNNIQVDVSTDQAKPGEDIDLTISTRPNSYVALLGVDQSVLLLKSGNDLSHKEVLDELEGYNQYYISAHPMWRRKRMIRWPYHGRQNRQDFENAGAVLLTNAKEPPIRRRKFQIKRKMYLMRSSQPVDEPSMIESVARTQPTDATTMLPVAQSVIKIRTEFPETFIWENFDSSGTDGRVTIHKKVPDTITSWIITGFAVDPVLGLGLTKTPRKLEVFQPFFVSLNLPYSIKRGEVVSIPIVVFNYMNQDVKAEVTLHNEDQEFEFTEPTNDVIETPKIELYRRKKVNVKSNDGTATSFMIKPKKVGRIIIKVTATSPVAGDGVERILPVEPEGVPQFVNKAIFLDLRTIPSQTTNLTIEIPRNAVPDSAHAEVSVVGDLLGSAIKNLDALIRMPFGCGEQNMLNFVPNIVVLNYLKSSGQQNPAIEAKAKKYMESGYQRELTYKHKDGSFSAFGESDKSGSTWLTAFVAKSFRQAADHIEIEVKIIDQALEWLKNVQAANGSFPEVGHVSHSDMQGGAGQGIALTAYTLIAFLENKNLIPKYRNTINKAMDYIIRNLETLDDTYALALASYALQLAEHNSKDFILQTLDAKATTKDGLKSWTKPIPESDSKNIWHSMPNSVNVEMTSYALLALIEAGHITDGLPVIRWLLTQQTDRGGFQSTQDTIVGLQALAKFSEAISSSTNNVQISIAYGDAEANLHVNRENSMILQSYELPTETRKIVITATGQGFSILQLSYRYNLNVTGAWPRFTLDPVVNKNSRPDYLHLTVCTSFVPSGGVNTSNMAVMEVAFPSGFTADLDTLPSLQTNNVKKVETKNGDTVVVLYFDDLGRIEMCPTLDAYRTHKVAHQKPAPVLVYDYYDNSRRARMFYNVQEANLCDICEGDDCGDSCTIKAAKQKSDPDEFKEIWGRSKATSVSVTISIILTVSMTILKMWI